MPSEILFVKGPHTDAMHGSMVRYIGHAAMHSGNRPGPVHRFTNPTVTGSREQSEHWRTCEARSA